MRGARRSKEAWIQWWNAGHRSRPHLCAVLRAETLSYWWARAATRSITASHRVNFCCNSWALSPPSAKPLQPGSRFYESQLH